MSNIIIKRNRTYYHKDCNGKVIVDRRGYKDIPLGFGDGGSGKFQIDCLRVTIVEGLCEKCGKDMEFQESKGKHITKYPRSINNKLRK